MDGTGLVAGVPLSQSIDLSSLYRVRSTTERTVRSPMASRSIKEK